MISFKNFHKLPKLEPVVKKDKTEMDARHLHPLGRDPYSHKKTPGKFVPEMHRVKHENVKMRRIKAKKSKFEVLNKLDVNEICKMYNVVPHKYRERKLGNTGIILRYDHAKLRFVLERT